MTEPDDKDNKNNQLPFLDSSAQQDQHKKIDQQACSNQIELKNDQQKPKQQRNLLHQLFIQKIDEQNTNNSFKHKPFQWELVLIDQKSSILGLKSKFKCRFIPTQLYIVIRVSFTQQFFKQGQKTQEGNIFAELEEVNFQISKTEIKNFQIELESIIKSLFIKTMYTEDKEEYKWINQLFCEFEKITQSNQYQKRPKKGIETLNRKQIVNKYISYHPPVCLTWSSRGLFCLTENKVPANRKSLIGHPLSFKKNIEVPKVSLKTTIQEEFTQATQQASKMSIYDWEISEELQLFGLNNHRRQMSAYYKDSNKKEQQSKKKIASANSLTNGANETNGGSLKNQYVVLEYGWKKYSNNMRKIFQRYFNSGKNDIFQYDMTRGQKLNVYFVLSENRRYEDELLYLMEKINTDKLKPAIEVVLGSILTNYPALLSSTQSRFLDSSQSRSFDSSTQFRSLDSIHYFVISELLREQNSKTASCQLDLSFCLKSIMVENQFNVSQIESYFCQCFKILGVHNAVSKNSICSLGSYMHFDQYKSQKILIQLLQQYEYHYERNQKNRKEVRFILQSKSIQRVKKHIKIKKIAKFPLPKQYWLLPEEDRTKFIMTILPVLLTRDQPKDSEVYQKPQNQSHDFIKLLIAEYNLYEQERKLQQFMRKDLRRSFTIYCQKCQKPTQTFEIEEAYKLRICKRCSESVNKKN